MANRIGETRKRLVQNLEELGNPHDWTHIRKQIGMFAYTGLKPEQVDRLVKEHHVYMTLDGRMSIAGLTSGNVDYVSEAFHDVTKDYKDLTLDQF